MYAEILALPKIELHCHLDGSVRPETLVEFASELGIPSTDVLSQIHVPSGCQSLVQYLSCFKLPLAFMQTTAQLTRIAREVVEDAAKDHVKYIEVRFAPFLHMENGLSFESIVSAVLKGLKEGENSTGTYANLILCCMRHMPVATSIEVVKQGLPFLGKGVVAIDLAGDEANFPPELHKEAFDLAKDLGYQITIHAGETGSYENVITAIEALHATRIGHGLAISQAPHAQKLVFETQTTLEMCPTSNLQTKAIESYDIYPFADFLNTGIRATLNTDNRTVSNVTLSHEIEKMYLSLSPFKENFSKAYLNAVEASFANDTVKAHLRSLLD